MFINITALSNEEKTKLSFELIATEKRDKIYSEENLKKYQDRLEKQQLNWEKQQIANQINEHKNEKEYKEKELNDTYLEMNKYYYNDE